LKTKADVHSILQSLRCTSKMPKKSLSGSQPVTKQGKAGDSMPALALDWKPLFNRVLFLNGAIFGEEAPEISQMWVVPKCVSKCP